MLPETCRAPGLQNLLGIVEIGAILLVANTLDCAIMRFTGDLVRAFPTRRGSNGELDWLTRRSGDTSPTPCGLSRFSYCDGGT
jgi:hypothetical protein